MIFSPDKDIAKNEVLDLESVQTKIKETIANMVLSGSTKEEIQSVLSPLIYNYLKKIKVDDATYKRKIEQSLLNLAQHQYFVLSNNMKTINSSLIKSMGGSYGIDLSNENASAKITQDKFRNFITKNKDTGTPLINRYENLVKEELKTLANQPAKVVSYNKNGKQITYTMSARNLAEMKIRYDANVEDVNKEKNKGTKLVWISSHSNCSPRCAPFQGRLYSLDGTKGTIAGHSYVPIEIAQAGKNGDGNGCTNGYNCRHYIIPTSEEELLGGQRPPTNYNNATIKKEQEIDAKQRMFENQIRKLKKEETNLRAGGFNDEAKKMNLKWKILEKKYQVYSLENHRSFSRWRTQISRDEEQINLNTNKQNFLQTVKENRTLPGFVVPSETKLKDNDIYLTENRIQHIQERHPDVNINKMLDSINSNQIVCVYKDKNHNDTINLVTECNEEKYHMITIKLGNKHLYNSIITARTQYISKANRAINKLDDDLIVYKKE